MKKRAVILGAGMVGSAMAADLAGDDGFEVTVVDARPQALARLAARCPVRTIEADLGDPAIVRRTVSDFDLVLGALSSVIGLQTLRAVITTGRPYCDISFMAEDATTLDALARQHGSTAVVDCGVAPGLSNLMAGEAALRLNPCERIVIYVGGLPVERRWPWEYKAGFAPSDVIEEYTRPARLMVGGKVVVREALSEPELLEFPGLGTLEAFNTDGLRSLASTLSVPDMAEKTLRYPGHIALMRVLRDTGLFSKTPITVGGQAVRPLDVTSALLFPKWTYDDGEADLTVMRVMAEGVEAGRRVRLVYELADRYDPATRTRSMSRTTAFPATIIARQIAEGRFPPGVHPPEVLARNRDLLPHLVSELGRRGVKVESRVEPLD
jgi:saccharopine dehydrogenase-like NADP-dependent oxidoreductase